MWGQIPAPLTMPPAETAALLAPPSTESMSPEQRAAFLPAGALLPADTDSFLLFTNVDKVLKRCGAADSPQAAMFTGIESVAFGMSDKAVRMMLALLENSAVLQSSDETSVQLAQIWSEHATEPVKKAIQEVMAASSAQTEQLYSQILQQFRVEPAYMALTVKPEAVPAMQMLVGMLAGQLSEGKLENIVKANGFTGVKIPDIPLSLGEGAEKELEVYLMYRMEGNSLLVVLCGEPGQAQAPASAGDSVLGKAELLNSCIGSDTVAVGSYSATLSNALSSGFMPEIAVNFVSSVFRKLAADVPAFGRSGVYAADGLEFIMQQLGQLVPTAATPTQFYVQLDEDVRIETVQDAGGMSFAPATLLQPAWLVNPEVAFYMEGAPITGFPKFDLPGILGAAGTVGNAVAQTLTEPSRAKCQAELDKALSYRADVLALADSLSTLSSGLTGSNTTVLTVPSATQTVEAAWYSPVSNRAALAEAWQQMMVIGERMQSRAGKSGKCLQPAPVAVGNAASYTVEIPADCKCPLAGMNPNVLVSDTAFAVGNSAALNRSLLESATGTMPLPGCVFQIRPAAGAEAMQRLATAAEQAGKTDEAVSLRDAAQSFRSVSMEIERIVGGSIILNNRIHTRVDVILNK